jgi:hypothetical protein
MSAPADHRYNSLAAGGICGHFEVETNTMPKNRGRDTHGHARRTVGALMLLLLLAATPWCGWLVRSGRIQQEAIIAIENDCGTLEFGPRWLRRVLGPKLAAGLPRAVLAILDQEHVGRVTSVSLKHTSDRTIQHVGELTELR